MAHWSENAQRLHLQEYRAASLADVMQFGASPEPGVYLFWFPAGLTDEVAEQSAEAFVQFADVCSRLPEESVIAILTTPPNAARLLPFLEKPLQFQLWIAVKSVPNAGLSNTCIPNCHTALLILTRYRGSLKHTKTRIQYTYCPACQRTTKDYGGKKHVYHKYGTLMSDVWRDIEIDPRTREGIEPVVDRLRDLFGLPPYRTLHLVNLCECVSLQPKPLMVHESLFPFEWEAQPISLESRLINDDCLQAMREIPSDSIDFCFADPPYNLRKKYDHWNDDVDSIAYFNWCDRWLDELARVLKPGRTLAVLNIPLWAVRHYQFLAQKLRFQCWIVWEALSFPVRLIMPAHYTILCFSKGAPRPLPGLTNPAEQGYLTPLAENFCLRHSCIQQRRARQLNDKGELSDLWYDIHRLKHNSYRVDHPCQLPPMLMRRLIALFTKPGEIVLDCFNGVGTTTLVAHQMGRRFIGIELSQKYHELALQRHQQVAHGIDPFAKRKEVPNAKNSPVPRLPKQKYIVSKKTLQLEVKRIAQILGRLPTREEVQVMGRYPMELYDRYFISWGEACAAARTTGMSERPPHLCQAKEEQLTLGMDE
ncbi:Modification methylase BamHI [bacterium HR15]|nr:Modification methylase BamHI [bacterium HR15]